MPKYPEIKVRLTGHDGNIYSIVGRVSAALRIAGVPREEIEQMQRAITESQSYHGALGVIMDWVNVS